MSGLERAGFVARETDADIAVAAPIGSLPPGKPCSIASIAPWPTPRSRPLGHLGRTRLTALRDLLVAFAPPPTTDLT